jgi:RNA polymerase sigma-70 factor, ECF subfamily
METTTRGDSPDPSAEHPPHRDRLPPPRADAETVVRLRERDEAAFAALVDEHSPAMLKLAATVVGSRAVAEEVVQDAWLAVLRGIDRFEGRSSLKTWIYRILHNLAKTRVAREGRSVPFSALVTADLDEREAAVEPERFLPPGHELWPGHWAVPPESWAGMPETRLLSGETMAVVRAAIESLPEAQRAAITLRDVQGWSAEEVCAVLQVSDGNQRVLLHRARSRVRASLERYLSNPVPA